MYSTCLFCNQSLGANQSIETFPVGRRLAFDAEHGRLWVVCRKCERWNLSPIEERWEAIESCERLFRDTRARVSTEHIGLARLAEGLELVRIGRPMRPEFAAWRYGDQFGRRRRRTILLSTGAIVVLGGAAIGGAITGVIGASVLGQSGNLINLFINGRTLVKLRTDDGRVLKFKNTDLNSTKLLTGDAPGSMIVTVGAGKRLERFEGTEAERVASIVVPKVNAMGGTKVTVQQAVQEIEERGGSEGYLDYSKRMMSGARDPKSGRFATLPKPMRLAVEMALHEERERRALEGELKILEEAWRQAEEIAAISDDLVVAPGTREFIAKIKSQQS